MASIIRISRAKKENLKKEERRSLSLLSFPKKKYPLPKMETLRALQREILPASYSLSIVNVGEKKAQSLNKHYRGKMYIPNVLSFPLSETEGEIVLCPSQILREEKKFGLKAKKLFLLMVIHGMLHLKGHAHSVTMERKEREWLEKFSC
ncbi:MAG: rRNA maturation RNase YbeY [Patescibacteria group bacterium]